MAGRVKFLVFLLVKVLAMAPRAHQVPQFLVDPVDVGKKTSSAEKAALKYYSEVSSLSVQRDVLQSDDEVKYNRQKFQGFLKTFPYIINAFDHSKGVSEAGIQKKYEPWLKALSAVNHGEFSAHEQEIMTLYTSLFQKSSLANGLLVLQTMPQFYGKLSPLNRDRFKKLHSDFILRFSDTGVRSAIRALYPLPIIDGSE